MNAAPCTVTGPVVRLDPAPFILEPFLATVKLLLLNVLLESMNITSSPVLGEAGSVTVTVPPEVSQKTTSLLTAG